MPQSRSGKDEFLSIVYTYPLSELLWSSNDSVALGIFIRKAPAPGAQLHLAIHFRIGSSNHHRAMFQTCKQVKGGQMLALLCSASS
jgi:hypothetical protein